MKFVGLTCKRLSRHRRLVVYYIKKLSPDFMGPYGVMWDTLLHLREAHNALQCPVFFLFFFFFLIFCQPYPEYLGIRSKKLFYRPSNS